MKICSACLLGINCRYDGKNELNRAVVELAKKEVLIPVCPEQFGGLPTPREQAELRGGKVVTKSGKDITDNCERGAGEVLKLARLFGIKKAIFKQKSPTCGCGRIFDGTFSGKVIKGDGVATALLKKSGIKIITEEDLQDD